MTTSKPANNKISPDEFISQQYEFFCTEDNSVIVILDDGSHLSTNNREFKRRYAKDYFHATGEWLSDKELNKALSDVGLKALAEAPVIEVVDGSHVRQESRHFFRQKDGSQLVVSTEGVGQVSRADSRMHFSKGSGSGYAIPTPAKQSLIDILIKNLNMASEQVCLFIGCLLMFFMPGPKSVMLFIGPQGSGKTLAAKIFRMIVDPDNTSDKVKILDNESTISGKLSDDLCRASHDRSSLVTTINDQMPNQDLVDRTIVFDLEPIADTARWPETKILAELKEDLPAIMWWIFRGLSVAQQNYQDIKLDSYPRLADFVQAVVAACPGLDMDAGEFLEALARNRIDSVERSLNQNPVSAAILDFMDSFEEGSWSGTGTALLELLNKDVDGDIKKHSNWPSKPNKLSAMLNRAAPFLKTRGLDIQWAKSGQRSITLAKRLPEGQESSQASMVEFYERQSGAITDDEERASVAAPDAEAVSVPPRLSKPVHQEATTC